MEDNGVGIAADKFDLLFQPFTQVCGGADGGASCRVCGGWPMRPC